MNLLGVGKVNLYSIFVEFFWGVKIFHPQCFWGIDGRGLVQKKCQCQQVGSLCGAVLGFFFKLRMQQRLIVKMVIFVWKPEIRCPPNKRWTYHESSTVEALARYLPIGYIMGRYTCTGLTKDFIVAAFAGGGVKCKLAASFGTWDIGMSSKLWTQTHDLTIYIYISCTDHFIYEYIYIYLHSCMYMLVVTF